MSPQKHAAQIANAAQSTGPRTQAGRDRSSQNSARHYLCGKKHVIAPEDREEFARHYELMLEALAPDGPVECQLAESIVVAQWRLTRAQNLESEIFAKVVMASTDSFLAHGEAWLAHSQELTRITLYEQRIRRGLAVDKAEFESRQSARRAAQSPVEQASSAAQPDSEPPAANPEAAPPSPAPESRIPDPAPLGFARSSPPAAPAFAPQAASTTPEIDAEPAFTPPEAALRAA